MTAAAHLLHTRRAFIDDVMEQGATAEQLLRLILLITFCGAAYGAVLGMWRSPLLALYVAIKMPMLLIVTAVLTAAINWMIAILLGLRHHRNRPS